MIAFLSNILSFPTLFYTGLLGLTLFYWLISMMGLADFDFDTADFDLDGIDADASSNSEIAESSGFLNKFKLDGIPLTISLSFVIFSSWIISFLLVNYYQDKVTEEWLKAFIGLWLIVLAPVVSMPIIGVLLSPLKPVFKKFKEEAEGRKANSLEGHIAIVRTNKVTMNFGDADIDSEGASLILKVRATEPNDLKRGDKIIIIKYLPDENVYMVRRTA